VELSLKIPIHCLRCCSRWTVTMKVGGAHSAHLHTQSCQLRWTWLPYGLCLSYIQRPSYSPPISVHPPHGNSCNGYHLTITVRAAYTLEVTWKHIKVSLCMYTLFNKNQAAWYFVSPAQAVTWHTVAIIILVVLVFPYLWIRGVSLSSIHYTQSRHVYINQRHQYICLIWS
jgi:hypothetical protein